MIQKIQKICKKKLESNETLITCKNIGEQSESCLIMAVHVPDQTQNTPDPQNDMCISYYAQKY